MAETNERDERDESGSRDAKAEVEGLLRSGDASWEEMEHGHDWHEACEVARAAVEDYLKRKGVQRD